MKNTPNSHPPITYLPNELLEVCELDTQNGVRMNASQGLLVLFNSKMTAGEMVDVIVSLHEIATHLKVRLVQSCALCEDYCKECQRTTEEWCEDCSAYLELTETQTSIEIPDYLREVAGIPQDAKLDACFDEETGEIILREADWNYDISDVPEFLLKELMTVGVCLPELDEALRMEYIIHAD